MRNMRQYLSHSHENRLVILRVPDSDLLFVVVHAAIQSVSLSLRHPPRSLATLREPLLATVNAVSRPIREGSGLIINRNLAIILDVLSLDWSSIHDVSSCK